MLDAMSSLNDVAARRERLKAQQNRAPLYPPQPVHGGKVSVPRRPVPDADACVARMLREESNRQISGGGRPARKAAPSGGGRKSAGNEKDSLIASMAGRLRQLERSQRGMRDKLVESEKRVLELQRENAVLKSVANVDGGAKGSHETLLHLERENAGLRLQIQDMERFLNDYGLVWVGDRGDSDGNSDENFASSPSVNARQLLEQLRELNTLLEDDAEVEHEAGVARLRKRARVPLAVFSDGILLRRGPFRPFSHPAARSFVADVLDGFFPSEFKDEYPDGVVFALSDQTAVAHGNAEPEFKAFSGEGKSVRGANRGPQTLANLGAPAMEIGTKEFLSSLPEKVVREGKVIQIRSGIAGMLGASEAQRPDIVLVRTPVVTEMERINEGCEMSGSTARPATPADVATLRVKSDSGQQTLIIKLRYGDTIGVLRKCIDAHRTKTTSFQILSAFPRTVYADDSVTLVAAGLVPNANLMVKEETEGAVVAEKK